jgi:hypothetical protein
MIADYHQFKCFHCKNDVIVKQSKLIKNIYKNNTEKKLRFY